MHGGPIRVLGIQGAPGELGTVHGSTYADEIRAYTNDRINLTSQERWSGGTVDRELILSTAAETLEHHERFSPSLFEEMQAMAVSAGITPEEAVAVGGFTDLVDVVRTKAIGIPEEHNCTGIVNPVAGFFAQTWDMHASAGEFVVMLDVNPDEAPHALVQTTTGCLGQMGMNEAGIAVGINNLTAMGKPGVTWPFVVRRVLEQTDIDDAIKVILDADLAGGHNYFVMGPGGVGATIEAMPTNKRVTRANGKPLVHANSCLFPETLAEEGPREEIWVENSALRLKIGETLADDLEAFFAEPEISRKVSQPHEVGTCGAVIAEPDTLRLRAVWGVPGYRPWETFQL